MEKSFLSLLIRADVPPILGSSVPVHKIQAHISQARCGGARRRLLSLLVMALVVVTGLAIWSVPAGAQVEAKQEVEAERGIYEVKIDWALTEDGKEVRIVNIEETVRGKVTLFRDPQNVLKIDTKMISSGIVEYRLKDVPLIVKAQAPFSIITAAIEVESNHPETINQLDKMAVRTHFLADNQQLILFDSIVTQKIPEGFKRGVLRVTYTCETCPTNILCLGGDYCM